MTHTFAFKTELNSVLSSIEVLYVLGNCRWHPHVCPIGVLENVVWPLSSDTVIVFWMKTSEPKTKLAIIYVTIQHLCCKIDLYLCSLKPVFGHRLWHRPTIDIYLSPLVLR
jgi:hypothetical protein